MLDHLLKPGFIPGLFDALLIGPQLDSVRSLRLKCPKCGHSLMDPEILIDNVPGIHLNIECRGHKGDIWLSSIYESYNYIATIDLPKNEIAKFHCPHCQEHITSKTECMSCGAFMVPFYLDMGGKVSICSRSGCKNHFVEFEDLSFALRKFYQEYGFSGQPAQHGREERAIDPEQLKKDEATGYGIPSGACLKVHPDGRTEALGGIIARYVKSGHQVIRSDDLLPG